MQYNYTSIDIIKTNTCITFNFYFTVLSYPFNGSSV